MDRASELIKELGYDESSLCFYGVDEYDVDGRVNMLRDYDIIDVYLNEIIQWQ